MPTITDPEFGEIVVRAHASTSRISIKIAPNGKLRVATPRYTPQFAVKAMISTSRKQIRKLLDEHASKHSFLEDQPIGKSHLLAISEGHSTASVELAGTQILVRLPDRSQLSARQTQALIREKVLKALRKEAKSYLPRRLKYLADQHGFKYQNVKLTHAGSRWGSCSTSGTISLNITLMTLPFELLDYVLIHELCHTREMNHSEHFWQHVKALDPNFTHHRTLLKQHSPNI